MRANVQDQSTHKMLGARFRFFYKRVTHNDSGKKANIYRSTGLRDLP